MPKSYYPIVIGSFYLGVLRFFLGLSIPCKVPLFYLFFNVIPFPGSGVGTNSGTVNMSERLGGM